MGCVAQRVRQITLKRKGACYAIAIADDSLDDIQTLLEAEDIRREITQMVNSLSPAEADVLKSCYGLEGRNAH